MAFDAHKNLAISSIAVAPSPPTSGLALSVKAGDGVLYPAVPFNATIWPAGVIPTSTNAEIIRVTARTADNFTILRSQEGTNARQILIGDLIVATITAKAITDLESGMNFPLLDLPEGIPADPPADTARLYALDVNGFTQVEIVDGASKVVRLASDNVIVAKVSNLPVVRGQCLYLVGAQGANPIIGLAKSDDIATLPCIGIAMDDGAVNAFVRVLVAGTLQKLNTSAFAEGASLFVSPTTAGSFTTTRPIAPALAQRVGFVTRSHATSGEVLVMTTSVDGPPRLHASTHEVGGTDPITGPLSISTLTTSGDIIMSPTKVIKQNVDTSLVQLFGGSGAVDLSRGAALNVTGGSNGSISLYAANGGVINLAPGGATIKGVMHASGGMSWGNQVDPGAGNLAVTGNVKATNLKWRQGHTFALAGDVSALPNSGYVPGFFVTLTGTQTAKIVGVRARIHLGTSVNITVIRNDAAVTAAITVTPTKTTTVLGDIVLANEDEIILLVNTPVGTPTNLNVTLFVEYSL